MARIPPDEEGSKRSLIIAATLYLLANEGVSAFTIRKVATRASVDPALLYHYFGSKEGLIQTALQIPALLSSQWNTIADEHSTWRTRITRLIDILDTPDLNQWIVALLVCEADRRVTRTPSILSALLTLVATTPTERLATAGILSNRYLYRIPDATECISTELLARTQIII
ncbi:MAG: TetR/AcrR family transcriptional regulator [Ferrimicrobium sp.]